MRLAFREKLEAGCTNRPDLRWNHVTDQIGMFCFTGLSLEQVRSVLLEHTSTTCVLPLTGG
jgi:aspartate/tyrosine/aromatic aminotransferase